MELVPLLIPVAFLVFVLLSGLRVLQQYQRGLVFRLGRYQSTRDPGLTWIIPLGVERLIVVDVRVMTQDIEPQETMTNDNVPVKVRAVVWFKWSIRSARSSKWRTTRMPCARPR